MRVEKKHKAFAYRVPIGDYNYLQCTVRVPDSFLLRRSDNIAPQFLGMITALTDISSKKNYRIPSVQALKGDQIIFFSSLIPCCSIFCNY